MNIIILVIVGAIAGWLAGCIMRGGGFGLIGNIIVGIIGSFIGGWLFGNYISIGASTSPYIPWGIGALLGAIILLFVIGLFKKAK